MRYALSVGQQQLYCLSISFVNKLFFAQGTFAFGRLFRQNMTGTGFMIDNFSGAGFSKSFCGGPICFYLWHIDFSSTQWCLFFVCFMEK